MSRSVATSAKRSNVRDGAPEVTAWAALRASRALATRRGPLAAAGAVVAAGMRRSVGALIVDTGWPLPCQCSLIARKRLVGHCAPTEACCLLQTRRTHLRLPPRALDDLLDGPGERRVVVWRHHHGRLASDLRQ